MTDPIKHFIIDVDYLNDLATNIAENVPEPYYGKFCRELREYLNCAIHNNNLDDEGSDYSSEDLSGSEAGSDLAEEEYEVNLTDDGFYELSECDVKDCNAVGKEEIKSTK